MLITVQFPISDLRCFLSEDVGDRLSMMAGFTTLDPTHDFVRSFGPVRRRLRGGVGAWPGEDTFAQAAAR